MPFILICAKALVISLTVAFASSLPMSAQSKCKQPPNVIVAIILIWLVNSSSMKILSIYLKESICKQMLRRSHLFIGPELSQLFLGAFKPG